MKIAVVGYSCTGKTTLTKELAAMYPGYKVIHTDDYASDYHAAHGLVFNEIVGKDDYIVDGVHAFEVLRQGAKNRVLFDVVIHCKTDPEKRMERYRMHRNPEQAYRQPGIEKSLDTIFNSYLAICAGIGQTPLIIDYHT